jgi:hypothetical protein
MIRGEKGGSVQNDMKGKGRPMGAPFFGGTGFQPVPHRRDACATIPFIRVGWGAWGEGRGQWHRRPACGNPWPSPQYAYARKGGVTLPLQVP